MPMSFALAKGHPGCDPPAAPGRPSASRRAPSWGSPSPRGRCSSSLRRIQGRLMRSTTERFASSHTKGRARELAPQRGQESSQGRLVERQEQTLGEDQDGLAAELPERARPGRVERRAGQELARPLLGRWPRSGGKASTSPGLLPVQRILLSGFPLLSSISICSKLLCMKQLSSLSLSSRR